MEVHKTALRHGVRRVDLEHAVRNHLYSGDLEESETLQVLYIGPDHAANLLEVITVQRDDGSELAIHAMKLRPKYLALLRGEAGDV